MSFFSDCSKKFSLSWNFISLIVLCLGMVFLFILFGIYWHSWIDGKTLLNKYEKFMLIISSNNILPSLLFSPPEIAVTFKLDCSVLPQRPLRPLLFSLSFSLDSLCCHVFRFPPVTLTLVILAVSSLLLSLPRELFILSGFQLWSFPLVIFCSFCLLLLFTFTLNPWTYL